MAKKKKSNTEVCQIKQLTQNHMLVERTSEKIAL